MKRAFGLYPRHQSRVPHTSLVFREMWDTAGLTLKPVADLAALDSPTKLISGCARSAC